MTAGSYLYAIIRPVGGTGLAGLRGVGDAPVRVVTADDLAGLVSSVDLAEFGEQALPTHLEDLGWLERTARAHDAVVVAAGRVTTTAPLRLATIFRDDDAVRQRLRVVGPQARAVLERLAGRTEWGVKLFATAPEPAAATVGPDATSGTGYLRRRREAVEQRGQAAADAAEQADQVYRRLASASVAGRRHRPQDPRLSGVDRPMLLNAAFLVDDAHTAQFRAAVEELAHNAPSGALELTGPWPSYSFADLDAPS